MILCISNVDALLCEIILFTTKELREKSESRKKKLKVSRALEMLVR